MQHLTIHIVTTGDVKANPEQVCAAIRQHIRATPRDGSSSSDTLSVTYELQQFGGDSNQPVPLASGIGGAIRVTAPRLSEFASAVRQLPR